MVFMSTSVKQIETALSIGTIKSKYSHTYTAPSTSSLNRKYKNSIFNSLKSSVCECANRNYTFTLFDSFFGFRWNCCVFVATFVHCENVNCFWISCMFSRVCFFCFFLYYFIFIVLFYKWSAPIKHQIMFAFTKTMKCVWMKWKRAMCCMQCNW